MYNPLDLSGKLILVTGASSGIGRAVAIVLSRLGARVILNGRNEAALSETLQGMDSQQSHVVAPFSLEDTDAIGQWLKQLVVDAGAPLHGFVHSAGIAPSIPLGALGRKRMEEVMAVNFYAAIALMRAASAKGVVSPVGASFIFLSSIASLTGTVGLITYAASKGALNSMVRPAAVELARKQIRVNCIAPAYAKTPMYELSREHLPGGLKETIGRQFLGLIETDEIGITAGFLLSDAARHVTGTTLVIDGGWCC